MADLFISYSRKDTEFVRILDAALVRSKYDTWVDWQNIPPTADWWEEIQSGIESAHTFIFILSPHSVGSKVCRQEIDHAVKHNKRLIPIVRRDVNAEDVHPALGKINWIHFRKKDDFQAKFQDLVKSIDIDLKYWKTHTTLLTQAIGWDKNNRDSGLLLRGRVLTEAAQWLIQSNSAKEPRPTQTQIDYVSASVDARRATNKQQRITIGILGTLLVLALGAGGAALAQFQKAESSRQKTERILETIKDWKAVEKYQRVVVQSRQLMQQELDKGLLLATAAMKELKTREASTGEVSQILYNRLKLFPPQEFVATHNEASQKVIFSPTGRYLATRSADSTVTLWDWQNNRQIKRWGSVKDIKKIAFSPSDDDRYFLVRSGNSPILWDLQANQETDHFNMAASPKDLKFSPNGQYLATLMDSKTVALWNLETNQKLQEVPSQKTIEKIIFSPKSQYLSILSSGNRATLWNLSTNKKTLDISYHGAAYDVRFSPNDGFFAYRFSGERIRVQSLTEDRHSNISHTGEVGDIRFSPNSPYVANRKTNDTFRVWDLQTNKESISYKGSVETVSFSPNGLYLATIDQNNSAIVWDLKQRRKVDSFANDNKEIKELKFSPNNRYLATLRVGEESSMRVWDLKENKEAARITHAGSIENFSFGADGHYLATGGSDNIARVWDLENNQELARIAHEDSIVDISFDPNCHYIATASRDKTARVWDLRSKIHLSHITNDEELEDTSLSPNNIYLATASRDSASIKVWNLEKNEEIAQISHKQPVKNVKFSQDNQYLATNSSDNFVRIWDWQNKREISNISYEAEILSISISPDNRYVAIGTNDNNAIVWDHKKNEKVASIVHEGEVTDVAFSNNGRYLATGSNDNIARVWDIQNDQEAYRFNHEGAVTAVSFSKDDQYLATGSADKTARVWNLEREIDHLDPILHDDEVTDVSFGNNGQYLATGSTDKTARVWDLRPVQNQQLNQSLEEWEQPQILEIARISHEDVVEGVNLHANGENLLTQSGSTAQVLPIEIDNLMLEACSRLPRNLTESEWKNFFRDEPYKETCPDLIKTL